MSFIYTFGKWGWRFADQETEVSGSIKTKHYDIIINRAILYRQVATPSSIMMDESVIICHVEYVETPFSDISSFPSLRNMYLPVTVGSSESIRHSLPISLDVMSSFFFWDTTPLHVFTINVFIVNEQYDKTRNYAVFATLRLFVIIIFI